MPKYEITSPDGRTFEVQAPEGASQEEVLAYAQQNYGGPKDEQETSTLDNIKQGAGNLLAGAVRGAGSIGATLLAPVDMAKDAMDGKGLSLVSNRERRAQMDAGLESMGAEPDSVMFKGGKLVGEIAGTAGAGGVLANGVRAAGATRAMSGLEPITNAVATGLQTGGFRVGELAGTGLGAATRVATGAAAGGTAAAMVSPEDAALGAAIGGAFPVAVKAAGALAKTGMGINKFLGAASPEVRALALRAEELGIKIPADRLVDSKTLNAMASSLNYVPMSGRSATEEAMNTQLNRALSRTFGQDSSNVTQALRLAQDKLGGKFETTLAENGVNFDRQLLEDLAAVANKAETELGSDGLRPIEAKIREIVAKGESGMIDGKAAYAIKRDLDRLGKANAPNAWHAVELKRVLMDGLDRSLGPEKAAAFATVRRQYGNMLSLEKLAKNGVEGEVSVARIANLPNINNAELQEIADIAAQFVKPREAAHGSAQRVFGAGVAGTAAVLGGIGVPAAIATGAVMGAGRGMNKALNSEAMRRSILNPTAALPAEPAAMGAIAQGTQRALPLAGVALGAGAAAEEISGGSEAPGTALQMEPVGEQGAPELLPAVPGPLSAIDEPPAPSIADIGSATSVDQAIAAASAVMEMGATNAMREVLADAQAQAAPAPEPVAVSMALPPVDGVMSAEPSTTWYGRRGDGYEAIGDAQMAMRTRQKASPEMTWRVEAMPSGRYRLAGYEPVEQTAAMSMEGEGFAAPGPGFEPIMQPDGTLAVRGDVEQLRQILAEAGINAIPRQGAVLVGTRQAQAAMEVLGALAA